ncbi:hypothetical protein [Halalkalibacter oceani]|uniref:hypothetical protein n=1 Tax=Halalkalibacter oceani TaxID=1653776 RepID=UPI0033947257
MNKYRFIGAFILILTIFGCSDGSFSGEKPPEMYIVIENEKYETKLGSYCWASECVDTVGPVELLKEKEPIVVNPGETIFFSMDYDPLPNEIYLNEINGTNEREILIDENEFSAPMQKGIYYYSYGVWWKDEKRENVSNGDAFYAFVLKVQ